MTHIIISTDPDSPEWAERIEKAAMAARDVFWDHPAVSILGTTYADRAHARNEIAKSAARACLVAALNSSEPKNASSGPTAGLTTPLPGTGGKKDPALSAGKWLDHLVALVNDGFRDHAISCIIENEHRLEKPTKRDMP
jgi:hypothetical protein